MRCLLTAVLLALQTLKKDDSESRNLILSVSSDDGEAGKPNIYSQQ